MGCTKLKYQNFSFLEVIHSKKKVSGEKKRINYYPFGLKHKGYNNVVNGTENNYQTYNGKEIEKALGLDWIDYGMRMYNPALGRWNGIDALAEKYHPLSGYSFVANDPIKFSDIGGMDIVDRRGGKNQLAVVDENGQIQFTEHASNKRNAGAVKVLQAMMKTEKGRQIVRGLIRSKTKTNINLEQEAIQNYSYQVQGEDLKLALGYTDYTGADIEVDDDGNVYYTEATIDIFESSFNIINGDKSSLPKSARGKKKVSKTIASMETYTEVGKFLNGVGTHEGTHVLEDLFAILDEAGIDSATFTGSSARKLFNKIVETHNKMNQDPDRPLETNPEKNEKETNDQYDD
jgi:RHS repeat-associated protein